MYAKSQQYKVFEPNKEVKKKFYKFLNICQQMLESLEDSKVKYVIIIPYATEVKYDTDNSRYVHSITYAIINSTEPIKNRNIHKSPYVIFKQNTDKDFVEVVRKALDLKGKQSGVVLVSDYPLHEQLNRELKQEAESNTISIKSIYTLALYYHIVNTLKKGNQVDKTGFEDICVDVSSGSKGFSHSDDENNSNLMMCNTTAATVAGIRKNDAVATINLAPEIVEATNITTGVPINGFNVVLTNAEYIINALQFFTHKSFSSRNEMQNTRNYSSKAPETNKITVDEKLKPYVKIVQDVAKIFFVNVPDDLSDF
jgi:hypothetical protein